MKMNIGPFLGHLTHRWCRPSLWLGALLLISISIQGCGFKLRGTTPLPFDTLYTNISLDTAFGAQLQRILQADSPGLRFVTERDQAQASLLQLQNRRNTREVALDPQGNVEEYQLNLNFRFELVDHQGHKILPPTTLTVTRYLPNEPDSVQAKESERAMLYSSMEQELIGRISRRLTAPDISARFSELAHQPTSKIDEGFEDLEIDDQELDDWADKNEEHFLPNIYY